MRSAQASFARFEALRREATSRAAAERQVLQRELETQLSSAEWQLEELRKTVDAVEANPARFGVDADEIASRRRWVNAQVVEVAQVRDGLAVASNHFASLNANGGGGGGGGGGGSKKVSFMSTADRAEAAAVADNDAFLGDEAGMQQQLMRQQDDELEALSVNVQRLGGVGLTISEELETHGRMLEELEADTDSVLGRLDAAQKRLQTLVKKAGMRGQICMIVALLILLIMLCAFTFYG